jgi:hypothetical protein
MALWRRDRAGIPAGPGLVHHSDASSQYTSLAWAARRGWRTSPSLVPGTGVTVLSGIMPGHATSRPGFPNAWKPHSSRSCGHPLYSARARARVRATASTTPATHPTTAPTMAGQRAAMRVLAAVSKTLVPEAAAVCVQTMSPTLTPSTTNQRGLG